MIAPCRLKCTRQPHLCFVSPVAPPTRLHLCSPCVATIFSSCLVTSLARLRRGMLRGGSLSLPGGFTSLKLCFSGRLRMPAAGNSLSSRGLTPSAWQRASLRPSLGRLSHAFGRRTRALLPGACGELAETCACSRSVVKRPALLPTARKLFGNSLAPLTYERQPWPRLTPMAGMSTSHSCTACLHFGAYTAARKNTMIMCLIESLWPRGQWAFTHGGSCKMPLLTCPSGCLPGSAGRSI